MQRVLCEEKWLHEREVNQEKWKRKRNCPRICVLCAMEILERKIKWEGNNMKEEDKVCKCKPIGFVHDVVFLKCYMEKRVEI